MTRRTWLLGLLAVALAVAGPAAAALKFDPTSKRGLVIVEVLPPSALTLVPEVSLVITPYDVAKGEVIHNVWNVIDYTPSSPFVPFRPTYVYAAVRPGTHVIKALYLQRHWGVCYDAGTVAFDVRPGEVLFLGSIETAENAHTIATTLPSTFSSSPYTAGTVGGRTAHGQSLTLQPPTEEAAARVRAFLDREHPGVTAPISAMATRPATFPNC
jgi:hypothetical protein